MAFWLRYAVIFAIIFATSAIYNCYLLSSKVILLLDSSHYLITVRHLHAFCIQALNGHLDQGWTALCGPQAAADIMIDGPILPAIGAIAYLISGLEPQATNWSALATVLSICLALMGCCIGITVENFHHKSKYASATGCVMALAAGFNPEGVIAASRFLTELPSATASAMIIALSSMIIFRKVGSITIYFTILTVTALATSVFLLKPALGLANFLFPAFVLCKTITTQKRRRIYVAISTMICSACIIFIPWCLYTYQATGQVHLTPERLPIHNLAKGNDIAVDAYSSNPSAVTSQHIEQLASPAKILIATWSCNPMELSALYLRKLQRIILTPWNDFIQTPYGIPEIFIRALHYYLVLSAVAGMVTSFQSNQEKKSYQFKVILGSTVIATLAFYLPFEGICRYGFPLYPALFTFCAFWHLILFTKEFKFITKWLLSTLLFCILLISTFDGAKYCHISLTPLIIIEALLYGICTYAWIKSTSKIPTTPTILTICAVVAGATTDPDLYQYITKVDETEHLELEFKPQIKKDGHRPENAGAILLINARPHHDKFAVSIESNTRRTKLIPIPLDLLDKRMASHANLKRIYSEIYNCNYENFFQWFACSIPKSIYNDDKNQKAIIKITGCDIVNSRDLQFPHISDMRYFSAGKLCNNPTSMDYSLSTSLPSESNLKFLQNNKTATSSKAQCFILDDSRVRTESLNGMNCQTPINAEDFDVIFRTADNNLLIDKNRIKIAQKIAAEIGIEPSLTKQKYLHVKLTGSAKSYKRNQKLGILITLSNNRLKRTTVLPYCPSAIICDNKDNQFSLEGLANLQSLGFRPTSVDIAFFPRDWPQYTLYGSDRFCGTFEVKNLRLQLRTPNLPELIENLQY